MNDIRGQVINMFLHALWTALDPVFTEQGKAAIKVYAPHSNLGLLEKRFPFPRHQIPNLILSYGLIHPHSSNSHIRRTRRVQVNFCHSVCCLKGAWHPTCSNPSLCCHSAVIGPIISRTYPPHRLISAGCSALIPKVPLVCTKTW